MDENTQSQSSSSQQDTLQNKYIVPLAIVVAGGLIASAIYFGDGAGSSTTGTNTAPTNNQIQVEPVSDKDHILGSRNAEVIIIEYSDTECPFCKISTTL